MNFNLKQAALNFWNKLSKKMGISSPKQGN